VTVEPDGGIVEGDAGDTGDAGHALSDAGAADAGSLSARDLRATCVDACRAQSACLQLSDSTCADDCAEQARDLAADCRAEALAEQMCLSHLSCEEAMAYALQGRRNHPQCGAQARAYFASCTYGHGTTPPACTALCARYQACGALDVTSAACEEQCILQATDYDTASGQACAQAYLAFAQCGAQASCADAKLLASQDVAPAGCDDELSAMQRVCE
jgi:hypothetical protein